MLHEQIQLHPTTKKHIAQFIADPQHAVLFEGVHAESGRTLLLAVANALGKSGNTELHLVGDSGGTIKIEEIKQLKNYLKLHVPDSITRCIVINDADRMTPESQNSLLKVMEEPPYATYFLLSSRDPSKLLATIQSRVARIHILPLSKNDFIEFAKQKGISSKDAERNFMITGGSIEQQKDMAIENEALDFGKKILVAKPSERISYIDTLLKDDALLARVLQAIEILLRHGSVGLAKKNTDARTWITKLSYVETAQTELRYGVTKRTTLTKLLLYL